MIFISCQDQKKNSETETPKKKIQLNDLSDKHPDKLRTESFLNNYKEEFIECESDTNSLKKQSLIQKQYCFQTNPFHTQKAKQI